MKRFLVESPHSHDQCEKVIKQVHSMGYLHHFEWGCEGGVHCGWAFIEADSSEEALMVVPTLVRDQARAVWVVKYGRESDKVE